MIKNRLAILLTERGLKATKVSNDTGIARSTLSKISNNTSEKIDYSTINSLCKYLKITPDDFFDYTPLDATFSFDVLESLVSDEEILNGHPPMYKAIGYINLTWYDEKLPSVEFEGRIISHENIHELSNPFIELTVNIDEESRESALKIASLSVAFQSHLFKDFKEFIKNKYDELYPNKETPDVEIHMF